MIDPALPFRIAQARAEYEAVQTLCATRSALVTAAFYQLQAEPERVGILGRVLRWLALWRG